jgi:hypothetical protein
MLKRIPSTVACLLVLAACAGGPPEPPPPPPFSPVGTYDISMNADGMQIGGVIVIEGSAETGYTGSIDTEMGGTGISDIVVTGTTVTFSIAEIGGMVELEFDGDEFMGTMSSSMGDASIQGMRREGG